MIDNIAPSGEHGEGELCPSCNRDNVDRGQEGRVVINSSSQSLPCAQEVATATRKNMLRMMRAEMMIPKGRELKNPTDCYRDNVAGDVESALTIAVQMEVGCRGGLGDRFSTTCH